LAQAGKPKERAHTPGASDVIKNLNVSGSWKRKVNQIRAQKKKRILVKKGLRFFAEKKIRDGGRKRGTGAVLRTA